MSESVVLVDDHRLFREGLNALLSSSGDIDVVGEAGDASEAYSTVERTNPDVVVMDISLPGASGIVATRELLRRQPARRVLLLTMHAESEFAVEGLAAGARGYALKHQPLPELLHAIQEVAHGRSYLSARIPPTIVEEHLRRRRSGQPEGGPCDVLTQREKDVFSLLVRGLANDSIAGQLRISMKTVETHRAHVLKKLGLHSVVELIRFAARNHLLTDRPTVS